VQLLCKLLFPRNDGKRRRSDSAKLEPIPSLDHLNRLQHFLADPNIDMKARVQDGRMVPKRGESESGPKAPNELKGEKS
jgi:hypothetical protein